MVYPPVFLALRRDINGQFRVIPPFTRDRRTAMSETPIHDWFRPRMAELVRQAERAGFERGAVIPS